MKIEKSHPCKLQKICISSSFSEGLSEIELLQEGLFLGWGKC